MEFFSGFSHHRDTFGLIFSCTKFTILLLGNVFANASVRYYKRLHNIGEHSNNYLCAARPKYHTIGILLTVTICTFICIFYTVMNTGADKKFSVPTLFLILDVVLLSVMVFYILKEQDSTIPIMKRNLLAIFCLDNMVEQIEQDDLGIYIGPPGSLPSGPMELEDLGIYMGPPGSLPSGPMELDDPGIYMGPPRSHPFGLMELEVPGIYLEPSGSLPSEPIEVENPGIYLGPPGSLPSGPMELEEPGLNIGPPGSLPSGPMELDEPGINMGPSGSLPSRPMELEEPGINMGPSGSLLLNQ